MRTLILNAGYEPLAFVSWQRALCLVIAEKAEVVVSYDDFIRTVSRCFARPKIVRLHRFIRQNHRVHQIRCTRRNILLRDKMRCQYCGKICTQSTASIDHIIPRSKGGQTTWTNVVLACHVCNRKKGHKSLKEVGLTLLSEPRVPDWLELTYGHEYQSLMLELDKLF